MGMDANKDDVATDEPAFATPVLGESRWPMAIAVLVLMAAALIAPPRLTILPGWLLAATEGLLLLALIVEDPGRIDRTGPWQRRTSIALVVVILASTLGATALLIYDLMTGSLADESRRSVAARRREGLAWQQHRLRVPLLGVRRRRASRSCPRNAALSRPRVPPAAQPGRCAS